MTVAANTVALNIIFGGLLLMVLPTTPGEKVASEKKLTQFKTRVQTEHHTLFQTKYLLIYDPNG